MRFPQTHRWPSERPCIQIVFPCRSGCSPSFQVDGLPLAGRQKTPSKAAPDPLVSRKPDRQLDGAKLTGAQIRQTAPLRSRIWKLTALNAQARLDWKPAKKSALEQLYMQAI